MVAGPPHDPTGPRYVVREGISPGFARVYDRVKHAYPAVVNGRAIPGLMTWDEAQLECYRLNEEAE